MDQGIKPKLINSQPKRLFTFGCSFTGYAWMTWAEIIAKDLKVPLYNYGESGAGNQYIFNMFIQANRYYKFDENDLVMICWTNVNREDRYLQGKWSTPGTIHINDLYDEKYISKFVDPTGYLIRDMASIDATVKILDSIGCQYHMMSMNRIAESYEQFCTGVYKEKDIVEKTQNFYKDTLDKILPSFYTVLWDDKIENKFAQEMKLLGKYFTDRHPTPIEYLEYLTKVFDYNFSTSTVEAVEKLYDKWYTICYNLSRTKLFLVYRLEKSMFNDFVKACRLVESEPKFTI